MKDFITESERKFDERFTEAIENIEWNWNEGEFVIDDLKTFLRIELLAAYEKGRKDFGEEVVGKVEGMREDDPDSTHYFYGYNEALKDIATLLRESVGEKVQ